MEKNEYGRLLTNYYSEQIKVLEKLDEWITREKAHQEVHGNQFTDMDAYIRSIEIMKEEFFKHIYNPLIEKIKEINPEILTGRDRKIK